MPNELDTLASSKIAQWVSFYWGGSNVVHYCNWTNNLFFATGDYDDPGGPAQLGVAALAELLLFFFFSAGPFCAFSWTLNLTILAMSEYGIGLSKGNWTEPFPLS